MSRKEWRPIREAIGRDGNRYAIEWCDPSAIDRREYRVVQVLGQGTARFAATSAYEKAICTETPAQKYTRQAKEKYEREREQQEQQKREQQEQKQKQEREQLYQAARKDHEARLAKEAAIIERYRLEQEAKARRYQQSLISSAMFGELFKAQVVGIDIAGWALPKFSDLHPQFGVASGTTVERRKSTFDRRAPENSYAPGFKRHSSSVRVGSRYGFKGRRRDDRIQLRPQQSERRSKYEPTGGRRGV